MHFQLGTFEGIGIFTGWLLAFSLGATALFTPGVMALARRVGAVDSGGHRKITKRATPLLGGLAIGIPFVLVCIAGRAEGWFALHRFEWLARHLPNSWLAIYGLAAEGRTQYGNLLVLALGATAIMVVGIVDDVRGMRARHKLLAQIAIAALVCLSGASLTAISLPMIGTINLSPAISLALCVFWITGMINAMNIIDGVDGLATGISLIASLAFCVIAAINGNMFMFVTGVALAGSLAAFLVFNFHPARIFLGDTGSMLLGFILGSLTLMGQTRKDTALIVLAPLLALSLPIFETFLSMARRFVRGLPIFSGDSQHTHHRLLGKGYSQRRVVLMLYAVAALLAASAVTSQALPADSRWGWAPMVFSVTALVWIAWLAGYLRPSSINSLLERRRRNGLLSALTRYAVSSLGSRDKMVSADEIFHLCRCEMRLTFLEAHNVTRGLPIVVCGTPVEEIGAERDPIVKTKINASSGHEILLRYQFSQHPDDLETRAVATALATIFENVDIALPPAKILDVSEDGAGGSQSASRRKHSS